MDMSSIGMGKGWEVTGAMRRLPIAIDQLYRRSKPIPSSVSMIDMMPLPTAASIVSV